MSGSSLASGKPCSRKPNALGAASSSWVRRNANGFIKFIKVIKPITAAGTAVMHFCSD